MSKIPKTNFWWQWRQTQQRLGEWIELQLNPPRTPALSKNSGGWSLQWLAPYITTILGVLLVGLLVFIIVRGVQGWLKQREGREFAGDPLAIAEDEPIVSQQEWLTRSQAFQRQGNFTQAARSLYFALLQNLSDRQLIPEKRSRTDQEYVAITQELGQPNAFATLLQTHEQIQFAGNELSAQDYERCQQAYGAADRAIAAAAQSASKSSTSVRSGAAQ
jgi:Domain of unknown function (DUF4129)